MVRRLGAAFIAACVSLALASAAAQSPSPGLTGADGAANGVTNGIFDTQALRVLAEQGDKRAAFLLGSRYAAGRGVPRDDSEAVRWFTMAAEDGLAEAQYNLGIMYVAGRGVPADSAKAVRWYERAAKQGLSEAQFNLGTLYGTGRGIVRDDALAAKWLTLAAQSGLARAQYNLATLYEHGRGVRLNARSALQWYAKAAEQGFDKAKIRHAALAKKMRLDSREAAVSAPSTNNPLPTARLDKPAGMQWVGQAPADQYTIQLASFAAYKDADRFAKELDAAQQIGIYQSRKGAKSWFSVVLGQYVLYDEALVAAANLPSKLRKLKPWVRNFGEVHKQMR